MILPIPFSKNMIAQLNHRVWSHIDKIFLQYIYETISDNLLNLIKKHDSTIEFA